MLLKTNSKFFPGKLTMKIGEHWECEMPDLGKATVSCHDNILVVTLMATMLKILSLRVSFQGIVTEMKKTMMICMKLGMKTITIKEKISGDFMIQECDVDGCAASKMKVVMVRL